MPTFPRNLTDEQKRAYRNMHRRKNYEKGNFGDDSKRRWSDKEIQLILFPGDKTDRELAVILQRSVEGIQIKRSRLKNANN